jgi:hypothetical protein
MKASNLLIAVFAFGLISAPLSAETASELYISMFQETFEKNERVAHVQTLKCEKVKGTYEHLVKTTQAKMKHLGLTCVDQRFTGEMLLWCRPDAERPNRTEFWVEAERGEAKCAARAQKRLNDY